MKTAIQMKYEGGEEVCSLGVENDASVMYSEQAGFFIQSTIWQAKEGRTWETFDVDAPESPLVTVAIEEGDVIPALPSNYRDLRTYRPISKGQAIRLFLDMWEDHGGMMTTISEALDAAGVEPLEELRG